MELYVGGICSSRITYDLINGEEIEIIKSALEKIDGNTLVYVITENGEERTKVEYISSSFAPEEYKYNSEGDICEGKGMSYSYTARDEKGNWKLCIMYDASIESGFTLRRVINYR